jgi:hypothetical protein
MQWADYRQLGVSHCSEVYWFLLVLWAAPILIAISLSSSPPQTQGIAS